MRRFWKLKRQADSHLLDASWEEAVGLLDQLLALNPRHEDSWYNRGNCHLELERYAEAIRDWESLLLVNPAASRAWVQIGIVQSMPRSGELFDLPNRMGADLRPSRKILWRQGELCLPRSGLVPRKSARVGRSRYWEGPATGLVQVRQAEPVESSLSQRSAKCIRGYQGQSSSTRFLAWLESFDRRGRRPGGFFRSAPSHAPQVRDQGSLPPGGSPAHGTNE